MKVKICGITNLDDAVFCSSAGVDALGFIFSKKSPRYIKPEAAKKIISQLDPFISKVGVFLDEDKEKVAQIASYIGLDVLQFHGKEIPSYCSFFTPKWKVVKVLFPQDRPFKSRLARYKVDAFLFDIQYEEKGKGVKGLSKEILKEVVALIKDGRRVIISGGLMVNSVTKIKKLSPYAVDVASGVENFVGEKDKELVQLFIRRAKDES